jgi:predicted Fe-Mo cluster-binding NifX family protein
LRPASGRDRDAPRSGPRRLAVGWRAGSLLGWRVLGREPLGEGWTVVAGPLAWPSARNPGARDAGRGEEKRRRSRERAKGEPMKVAITSSEGSLDAEVDPRFGRARFFLIVDSDSGTVEAFDNSGSDELSHGAGIAAVEVLVRREVAILVTGQVGPKAEQGLRAAGIEVRRGAAGRCRDALAAHAPELREKPIAAGPVEG